MHFVSQILKRYVKEREIMCFYLHRGGFPVGIKLYCLCFCKYNAYYYVFSCKTLCFIVWRIYHVFPLFKHLSSWRTSCCSRVFLYNIQVDHVFSWTSLLYHMFTCTSLCFIMCLLVHHSVLSCVYLYNTQFYRVLYCTPLCLIMFFLYNSVFSCVFL